MALVETTTYRVETVYTVVDKASRGLGEIDSGARRAASSAEGLSSVLKGIGVAVIGSAGIGAAKNAFIDFNSQVQDTKSQIAGMLALASKTSFTDNIARADVLFANLQKRAASLPGTTQEYATMMGMITQPVVNAGLGMKALEDLTVNSVVAAKALRVEAGAAARDIDQALRGQYHSVDVFTGKLLGSMGYAGEAGRAKFNALDSAKRAAELQKAIMQPQIAEMAAAQGASFSGVMSTLEDNFQQLGGRIGLPLFKLISKEIENWNTWLDRNSVKVDHIVDSVSHGLVRGFEVVKDVTMWVVDHADVLISIGKVWAAGALAGKIGDGLGGTLGGVGKALAGGKIDIGLGGIVQLGVAAYMAGDQIGKLSGAHDAILRMIDPQRAEYERLKHSMQEWDDALEQSRRNLTGGGKTGPTATNAYANIMGSLEMRERELRLLRAVDQMQGPPGSQSFIRMADKLREGDYSEKEISRLATDPTYRKELIARRQQERDTVSERARFAASGAEFQIGEVMKQLTAAQIAGIDQQKGFQQVMEEMIHEVATTGRILSSDRVREILLGEENAATKDPFAQGKPNVTNIKIDRVEVAAKDPDRWIADLDAAAKSRVNAPRSPRAAVRGR